VKGLPEYLTVERLDAWIAAWLEEDVGTGDVTTMATISRDQHAEAVFVVKEDGVLAGVAVAERIFTHVDPSLTVSWTQADGDWVEHGKTIGRVAGSARSILTAERLALNVMQRMSGIATATRAMVDMVGDNRARILDTRKTAPGLRLLDKWAVRLGGGLNHRLGLYDMIMIKDNHIASTGGIRKAVADAVAFRSTHDHALEIEVEVSTLDEVREAAAIPGIDRLLLDNMVSVSVDGSVDSSTLEEALRIVGGRVTTEASGNVTARTLPKIAATGVDYISSGAITHSARALDISLEVMLH
jgi:nicotinate-nucleotide pyrophosphorylase (carboxylating)